MRVLQLREEGAKEDIDLVPALKDYYNRHMANGTFVSWLALENDKIIGTSGMSFVEKPPDFGCPNGRVGLLSSMYTEPGYRRKGIAKELLTRVVNEARVYGCVVKNVDFNRYVHPRGGAAQAGARDTRLCAPTAADNRPVL